ncbi:YgaP family membrane protein [Haloarcula amylovorans]|uniref:YgaP family membrane protein n=1 Tax=Haloarcula amylovorans TaxID=2562280 RepID=UPI001076AA74|nr:DUF2892 domain-containing protein [Halomicroarcula amylolytica]
MYRNVGGYDRIGRAVFGPLLLVVGASILLEVVSLDSGPPGTAVGVLALAVGVVFLLTAATQWCPLNALTDIDTTEGKRTIGQPRDEFEPGNRTE